MLGVVGEDVEVVEVVVVEVLVDDGDEEEEEEGESLGGVFGADLFEGVEVEAEAEVD